MYTSMLAAVLSALSFALPTSAFLRAAPDRPPSNYSYSQHVGVLTADVAVAYTDPGIKSYWWANFLHAENGHDYALVITSANSGNTSQISSISLSDITANVSLIGTTWTFPGQLSNTTLKATTPVLSTGTTSADNFTNTYAISDLPGTEFNLTYTAQGPNLYQTGSGAFVWGPGIEYTIDAVETLVAGTLFSGENQTRIVSGESAAWFDIQWGPSYVPYGWTDYVILLDNGIRIQATILMYSDAYPQASYATLVYPDGHHEVWPLSNETYAADPWVSPVSNLTYFSSYQIVSPDLRLALQVTAPVHGGETAPSKGSTPLNTIADTFSYFSGTLNGLVVSGYGIAELRHPATSTSFA